MNDLITHIQPNFDKVISYSQNYPQDLNTTPLLEKWYEAKKFFIDSFGGKTIYECPDIFHMELDKDAKHQKVMAFNDYVCGTYGLYALGEFVLRNEEGFFENSIVSSYQTRDRITDPNGSTYITLSPGMKLLKSFKYFINDENVLYEVQTKASAIIQENKLEGKFCVSVDPLDFLSISETAENWRSCHALDGEYRCGNLSYMMDKTTFIVYVKALDDKKLPRFPNDVPWNSKKWRMLMFLADDHNALFAGRQYPFFLRSMLEASQAIVFNAFNYSVSNWSMWSNARLVEFPLTQTESFTSAIVIDNHTIELEPSYDQRYLETPYINLNHKMFGMNHIIKDGVNTHHFNDLLKSSCYVPYYIYRKTTKEGFHWDIGAEAPCVICGEEPCSNDATLVCDDCAYKYHIKAKDMYCDRCGDQVAEDDVYWVEGDALCPYCYENCAGMCNYCEEYFYSDNLTYVAGEGWLCPHCYRCYIAEN